MNYDFFESSLIGFFRRLLVLILLFFRCAEGGPCVLVVLLVLLLRLPVVLPPTTGTGRGVPVAIRHRGGRFTSSMVGRLIEVTGRRISCYDDSILNSGTTKPRAEWKNSTVIDREWRMRQPSSPAMYNARTEEGAIPAMGELTISE